VGTGSLFPGGRAAGEWR